MAPTLHTNKLGRPELKLFEGPNGISISGFVFVFVLVLSSPPKLGAIEGSRHKTVCNIRVQGLGFRV